MFPPFVRTVRKIAQLSLIHDDLRHALPPAVLLRQEVVFVSVASSVGELLAFQGLGIEEPPGEGRPASADLGLQGAGID